jgi:hypothetical protein
VSFSQAEWPFEFLQTARDVRQDEQVERSVTSRGSAFGPFQKKYAKQAKSDFRGEAELTAMRRVFRV